MMTSENVTVKRLLTQAETKIAEQTDLSFSAPALEARLLFEFVSGKAHSWQIVYADQILSPDTVIEFQSVLAKRLAGMPIAFIIGTQDFWSLNLAVDSCTLIPRQDTESLVEAALHLPLPDSAEVVDLGTGTGAIALALAKERPLWTVMGVDYIEQAVALAKRNAQRNRLDVEFLQSDWFSSIKDRQFHLIVTNPPYVETDSAYLQQGDLRFEPMSALCSGEDGLDDIRIIIEQAFDCLFSGGYLVIEHGFSQAQIISELLHAKGYVQIATKTDYNGLSRVTLAQKFEEI